jgi:HEAT repeat protein
VGKLTAHPEGRVRLACLEVMVRLKAASLYAHIEALLGDPERGVRIAAARAVGMLRYQPASRWLSDRLESKEFREADLSERMAVFQSYGTVAEAGALELLDRFLNGRRFLGRREDEETRACAALALAQISGDAARAVLMKARDEQSPIVRNAVRKALKPPAQAGAQDS